MKTAAVVVAAYRADPEWLFECVDSVLVQEPLEGWRWDLRVGVDGCEATAKILSGLGLEFDWSPINVGPYLIRNSLALKTPADAFAVFDADDTMDPTYLRTLVPLAEGGIAGGARRKIDAGGRVLSRSMGFAHGPCVISADAWAWLGGYAAWRIAADMNLIQRATAQGIEVRKHVAAIYSKREHPNQLTQGELGMQSHARILVKKTSKQAVAAGELWIDPVTVPLERRP